MAAVGSVIWIAAAALVAATPGSGRAQSFGAAVALSSGRLFVAQPAHEREPGSVSVFRERGGEWVLAGTFMAPEPETRDGFGAALAELDGELFVATGGMDGARVYVYPAAEAEEGAAPALALTVPGLVMAGGMKAAGARLAFLASGAEGRPRLLFYERGEDGRWMQDGAVDLPEGFSPAALAFDGVRAAVTDVRAGSALLIEKGEDAWTRVARLASPDSDSRGFGSAVVFLEGDALISGGAGAESGSAIHRYSRQAEGWAYAGTPLTGLAAGTGGAPGSATIRSLAVDGSTLYALANSGMLTFLLGREEWTAAISPVLPSDDRGRPGGGTALAVNSDMAIVGDPSSDFGAGAAYVAEREEGGWLPARELLPESDGLPGILGEEVECLEGAAAGYACDHVDLLAFLPREEMGAGRGIRLNDVWGWTDPASGREIGIVGRMDGVSFVEVTDPNRPRYLGDLPMTPGSAANTWRDIKVFKDHAFVVADGAGAHGMQIFDLTQLLAVTDPRTFEPTTLYSEVQSVHNVAINEETGFAYLVGASGDGETCGGGSHIVDINDPLRPSFAGCFAHGGTGRRGTGNTHDAQCVVYRGPDERYSGREICVSSNETALSVADVTDKENPVALASADYPNVSYAHQGWFTEDQRYFFSNDELDEVSGATSNTRTLIWDLQDLEDPILIREYMNPTKVTDHNLYVRGDRLYMSNNRAGLRVLDIADPENPTQLGYFDTTPWSADAAGFDGTWSVYPYFESGTVLLSSRREGLFLVRPRARRLIP